MIKLSDLKKYADKVKPINHLLTKEVILRVAGVTFDGRQEVLEKVTANTRVSLARDPFNTYDPYAIKVLVHVDGDWRDSGFLPKAAARKYSPLLDGGEDFKVEVYKIKGGFEHDSGEKASLGLDIIIKPV